MISTPLKILLGSIFGRFWDDFGIQNRPKIHPESVSRANKQKCKNVEIPLVFQYFLKFRGVENQSRTGPETASGSKSVWRLLGSMWERFWEPVEIRKLVRKGVEIPADFWIGFGRILEGTSSIGPVIPEVRGEGY